MKTSIPVEQGDTLAALQNVLKKMLESGLVEALLVPMRTPSGTVTPALVSKPDLLVEADPLAPVLPVNSATLVGKLSIRKPRPKLGAVLRSCELRALVELTKLQQASLEDLVLISIDCAGTYSVPVYNKKGMGDIGKGIWQELYQAACDNPGKPNQELRPACQICEQPAYNEAHIIIELFGSDIDREIRLSMPDDLAEKLGISPADENERAAILEKLIATRTGKRDAEFAAIRSRLEEGESITGVFAACLRCHNCMTVCPICYCKTCVFKSAIFDHEPLQFVEWARQKGAYRLPADTMLFHLTRLNHMVLSCVGCGMCTEACPAELPVGVVFRAIGQRLQETFEYAPGRSLEEPLPLITFKADEWTEVGE